VRQQDQPLGLTYRQLCDQDLMRKAEHRGVRTEGERQRGDRDERERRVPAENAARDAGVAPEVREPSHRSVPLLLRSPPRRPRDPWYTFHALRG
jgi:hypothetical protein